MSAALHKMLADLQKPNTGLPLVAGPVEPVGKTTSFNPGLNCIVQRDGESFIHDPERPDRTADFFGLRYKF